MDTDNFKAALKSKMETSREKQKQRGFWIAIGVGSIITIALIVIISLVAVYCSTEDDSSQLTYKLKIFTDKGDEKVILTTPAQFHKVVQDNIAFMASEDCKVDDDYYRGLVGIVNMAKKCADRVDSATLETFVKEVEETNSGAKAEQDTDVAGGTGVPEGDDAPAACAGPNGASDDTSGEVPATDVPPKQTPSETPAPATSPLVPSDNKEATCFRGPACPQSSKTADV